MNGSRAGPLPRRLTETEFRGLYERLRRLVPWQAGDRRGALNYITGPSRAARSSGRYRWPAIRRAHRRQMAR